MTFKQKVDSGHSTPNRHCTALAILVLSLYVCSAVLERQSTAPPERRYTASACCAEGEIDKRARLNTIGRSRAILYQMRAVYIRLRMCTQEYPLSVGLCL
jgi:hypothetical protein